MKVCIYCAKEVKEKDAIPVKEDRIIKFIRKVKSLLGTVKNNELYVCSEHLEDHKKRRNDFEKMMLISSLIAAALLVIFVAASFFAGRFELGSLFAYIVLAVVILSMPLFKYVPAVKEEQSGGKGGKAAG